MEFRVLLTSVSDVKEFVDAAASCPAEIDVLSGRYVVNGKSIMGLFSIDMSAPITVVIHGDGAEEQRFAQRVARFCAE